MSNLGPQQQNLSFGGLLQVPGGITNSLQAVQDGFGNTTGLQISSSGISGGTVGSVRVTNNGVVYNNSVIRLISDTFGDFLSVKDFGAVGDGVTNDSVAIQNAINTGKTIFFPTATYLVNSVLLFNNSNQLILINGSTLIFTIGLTTGAINVTADNVNIDLGGGILDQGARYATIATNTVVNGTTITVVDSSRLMVGQTITSSWGDNITQFPLGGPNYVPQFTITNINGNIITLNAPMLGTTVTMPAAAVIGNYSWGAFISCSANRLKIYNGTIKNAVGYYYATPAGAATDSEFYFQNIYFQSNGLDQFFLRNGQKAYLSYCTINQQFDFAKTGFYFDANGSVFMDNCNASLGNYDQAFTLAAGISDFTDGEISVTNCVLSGKTYMPNPGAGFFANDSLVVTWFAGAGTFKRINFLNTRITNYTRWFLTSNTDTLAKNQVVQNLRVDNCLIDSSFAFFKLSGAGNGINIASALISNSSFYQSNSGYQFFQLSDISGATSFFTPSFDNCYFKLNGTSDSNAFYSPCYIRDSIFSNTELNYYINSPQITDCVFKAGSTLKINPTYDPSFYGTITRIEFDNSNFPTNPNALFSAQGGSALSGAYLASAKSINGSVYYDVYKLGSNINVSATFKIANGVYFLRGDDYFIPIGSKISDMYLGTTQAVTFNLLTTLASAASVAATSIVVASAAGIATGDKINILADNGLVNTVTVNTYTSGTTIPLTSGILYASAAGSKVNFFRVV